MFALVSLWQHADSGQERLLTELNLPLALLVRDSPGYVESYWTYEQANGKSIGFTLFDTADHAHDLKNRLEHHMEAHSDRSPYLEMLRVQKLVGYVRRDHVQAPPALQWRASEPNHERTLKRTMDDREGELL